MSQPTDSSRTEHLEQGDVDHDLIAMADGDRYTDADLYNQIDKSQRKIPWWLLVMIGVVLLLAVVLNAPFLKGQGATGMADVAQAAQAADGEGFVDVGMLMALVYVGGGFAFIYWYTCVRKGS
jgi:hypothetical protein